VVLRATLGRWAARRPHVLLVDSPGHAPGRLAAERWCRGSGAVLADSPADADILVVAGPVDGVLAIAVDELWRQMPGPRIRVDLDADEDVAAQMDTARSALADPAHEDRGDEWDEGSDPHTGHDMGDDGDPHAGHDMGDMQMPAGLEMADRAEDRDGLKLDFVPFALGPVLPGWSTGLVVDVVLQGDVVQEATARPFTVTQESFWHSQPKAARFDCAARLLTVLDWPGATDRAAAVRDRLLDSGHDATATAWADRLRRHVARSRLVRADLAGLAVVDRNDALGRLLSWLMIEGDQLPFAGSIDEGLRAIEGLEFSAARLALASLPIDLGSEVTAPTDGHRP